jgi:hypothetical protein
MWSCVVAIHAKQMAMHPSSPPRPDEPASTAWHGSVDQASAGTSTNLRLW